MAVCKNAGEFMAKLKNVKPCGMGALSKRTSHWAHTPLKITAEPLGIPIQRSYPANYSLWAIISLY
jgi:hypothetical protein